MIEAIVTINGVQLTVGQSMTLRLAVASFLTTMQNEGLGEDGAGKAMADAYIARASEIEQLLIQPFRIVSGRTSASVGLKQCAASGGHNDCPNSALPDSQYCAEHSNRRDPWTPV
jgi:hypothetical protein